VTELVGASFGGILVVGAVSRGEGSENRDVGESGGGCNSIVECKCHVAIF